MNGIDGRTVYERGYGVPTKQVFAVAIEALVGQSQALLEFYDVQLVLDLDRKTLAIRQIDVSPIVNPQLGWKGRRKLESPA